MLPSDSKAGFADSDFDKIINLLKSKPAYFENIINSLNFLKDKKPLKQEDIEELRGRLLRIFATENQPTKFEDPTLYDVTYQALMQLALKWPALTNFDENEKDFLNQELSPIPEANKVVLHTGHVVDMEDLIRFRDTREHAEPKNPYTGLTIGGRELVALQNHPKWKPPLNPAGIGSPGGGWLGPKGLIITGVVIFIAIALSPGVLFYPVLLAGLLGAYLINKNGSRIENWFSRTFSSNQEPRSAPVAEQAELKEPLLKSQLNLTPDQEALLKPLAPKKMTTAKVLEVAPPIPPSDQPAPSAGATADLLLDEKKTYSPSDENKSNLRPK